MNLHSRFVELAVNSHSNDPVERLVDSLDPETGELLLSLLRDPKVSIRSIHDAIRAEHHSIARDSLTKYRKKLLTS